MNAGDETQPLMSDDVQERAERRQMETRIDELEDLVKQQARRIDELEKKVENNEADERRPDIEKFARGNGYDGLSANRERAVRIWEEFVEYAERNAVGTTTYSLNYDRLKTAAAGTCKGIDAKKDVDSKTAESVRSEFEEIAPVEISTENGLKKVVVKGVVWAMERPDEVASRLMPKKEFTGFVEGDS